MYKCKHKCECEEIRKDKNMRKISGVCVGVRACVCVCL